MVCRQLVPARDDIVALVGTNWQIPRCISPFLFRYPIIPWRRSVLDRQWLAPWRSILCHAWPGVAQELHQDMAVCAALVAGERSELKGAGFADLS